MPDLIAMVDMGEQGGIKLRPVQGQDIQVKKRTLPNPLPGSYKSATLFSH